MSKKRDISHRAVIAIDNPTADDVEKIAGFIQLFPRGNVRISSVFGEECGENGLLYDAAMRNYLNNGNVDDIVSTKTIIEHVQDNLSDKRIYRTSPDQLRNPDLPATAESNLMTRKVPPRVSEEHLNMFNAAAELFPTKRKALERAIELLVQEAELDI